MDKKEKKSFEQFDIASSGSLLDDLKSVDIKLNEVPDIEVREVVIKETGNFLNLQENIINIPIEMIVFPFFTPQKQNKRVNFQYSFEDLGVTMYCTLVAKDSSDQVFQPSIFEEKIYTYLISMYEVKSDSGDTDEYIQFEISDFIVNFLGNKMNRNYYSKVEQALKNLKNTEYQFVVSNHTKLGNYKFEDEEFKLLTYQKLKVGKKVFYRVTLNNNIRSKIQDKRYIKYNSRALLEILAADPIAARIYKYISKIRYEDSEGEINIRTLAAIIPLKMEQATERVNKKGEVKVYVLSRVKQVLKRIRKAFDTLKKLGYIEKYKTVEVKSQDTFFIKYKFNKEKDGACHISSFIEMAPKEKSPGIQWDNDDVSEAIIVDEKKKSLKSKDKKINTEEKTINHLYKNYPDELIKAIFKAKKNIYVSKSWNKRVDNKIQKIVSEDGVELAIEVLKNLYKSLNTEIKSTLVQYMNGILKNITKNTVQPKKENLTLFGLDNKKDVKRTKVMKINKSEAPLKATDILKDVKKEMDGASGNEKNSINSQNEEIIAKFDNLDDYKKLKVEEEALKLCAKKENVDEKFLLTLKGKSKNIYHSTIKKYLIEIMKKELESL